MIKQKYIILTQCDMVDNFIHLFNLNNYKLLKIINVHLININKVRFNSI
jgi:hypothetical protein